MRRLSKSSRTWNSSSAAHRSATLRIRQLSSPSRRSRQRGKMRQRSVGKADLSCRRWGYKKNVRWPVSRVLSFLRRGDHSSGMGVATHLTRPTRTTMRKNITCRPYLVLLPVGLALPLLLPGTRCALTAPFQPCRAFRALGGVISVALSLGSPPPDVIRHRLSVEPGLSSTHCCAAVTRPSDAGLIRPGRLTAKLIAGRNRGPTRHPPLRAGNGAGRR